MAVSKSAALQFKKHLHYFGDDGNIQPFAGNPQFLLRCNSTKQRSVQVTMHCEAMPGEEEVGIRFFVAKYDANSKASLLMAQQVEEDERQFINNGITNKTFSKIDWGTASNDVVFSSRYVLGSTLPETVNLDPRDYIVLVAASKPIDCKVYLSSSENASVYALVTPVSNVKAQCTLQPDHISGNFSAAAPFAANPQFVLDVFHFEPAMQVSLHIKLAVPNTQAKRFWISKVPPDSKQNFSAKNSPSDSQSPSVERKMEWPGEDIYYPSKYIAGTVPVMEILHHVSPGRYFILIAASHPQEKPCPVEIQAVGSGVAPLQLRFVSEGGKLVQSIQFHEGSSAHRFGYEVHPQHFCGNPQLLLQVPSSSGEGVACRIDMKAVLKDAQQHAMRFWVAKAHRCSLDQHRLSWIGTDEEDGAAGKKKRRGAILLNVNSTGNEGGIIIKASPFLRGSTCLSESLTLLPGNYIFLPVLSAPQTTSVEFSVTTPREIPGLKLSTLPPPSCFTQLQRFSKTEHYFGLSTLVQQFAGNPQFFFSVGGVPAGEISSEERRKVSAIVAAIDLLSQKKSSPSRTPPLYDIVLRMSAKLESAEHAMCFYVALAPEESTAANPIPRLLWEPAQDLIVFESLILKGTSTIIEHLHLPEGRYVVLTRASEPQSCDVELTMLTPSAAPCSSSYPSTSTTSALIQQQSALVSCLALQKSKAQVQFDFNVKHFYSSSDVSPQMFAANPQYLFEVQAAASDRFANTSASSGSCVFLSLGAKLKDSKKDAMRFWVAPAIAGTSLHRQPRKRNIWEPEESIVIGKSEFLSGVDRWTLCMMDVPPGRYHLLMATNHPQPGLKTELSILSLAKTEIIPLPYQSSNWIFDGCQASFQSAVSTIIPLLQSKVYERFEARKIVDAINRYCRKNNVCFRDEAFFGEKVIGQLDVSLLLENEKCNANEVAWKRFVELADTPTVNQGEGDVFQTEQGKLGDCWLVSAIAATAMRVDALGELVYPRSYRDAPGGAFCVSLWHKDSWKAIILDDSLPVLQGSHALAFVSGHDRNEVWVPLIEKAMAKLMGSYQNLIGGHGLGSNGALELLNGGPVETISVSDPKIISALGFAERKLHPMVTAANFLQGEKQGIFGNHIYAVMAARTVSLEQKKKHVVGGENAFSSKTVDLIQLRNPWGKKEWQGDWGRDSPLWKEYPFVAKACQLFTLSSGSFWMDVKSFTQFFGPHIWICRPKNELRIDHVKAGEFQTLLYILPEEEAEEVGNPRKFKTAGETTTTLEFEFWNLAASSISASITTSGGETLAAKNTSSSSITTTIASDLKPSKSFVKHVVHIPTIRSSSSESQITLVIRGASHEEGDGSTSSRHERPHVIIRSEVFIYQLGAEGSQMFRMETNNRRPSSSGSGGMYRSPSQQLCACLGASAGIHKSSCPFYLHS